MAELAKIGFLGLGEMGLPMVKNLLAAGYPVVGFDLNTERLGQATNAGAVPARSAADLVRQVDYILTSLPSNEIFLQVARQTLLPNVRPGQVVIDLGTTTVHATRELARELHAKNAAFLDVPVSGGPGGVERKQLRMFAGGDAQVFDKARSILEALGGKDLLFYCGPSGAGQAVKGVNQLMMGLAYGAYIEAVSFGVNAGVDPAIIQKAVGGSGWLRQDFSGVAGRIAEGKGNELGVKFRELPYFIEAAATLGFQLPITESLYRYCEKGERVTVDDHRPAPAYWHELSKK